MKIISSGSHDNDLSENQKISISFQSEAIRNMIIWLCFERDISLNNKTPDDIMHMLHRKPIKKRYIDILV
jgi:hypothetical protein